MGAVAPSVRRASDAPYQRHCCHHRHCRRRRDAARRTLAESGTVAKPFAYTIRPRQFAEECFKLPAGETIGYAFEASAPVDFNIHYHRGNDVEYPVKGDQVRQADDRFTASVSEEFCLMWTNSTLQMVTVKGDLRR